MSSKSTRVGLSLPTDLIACLDDLCAATGYSRSAVLHSLAVNALPEMSSNAIRLGVEPLDSQCRYRGASATRLDLLIGKLLLSLEGEVQLVMSYEELGDE